MQKSPFVTIACKVALSAAVLLCSCKEDDKILEETQKLHAAQAEVLQERQKADDESTALGRPLAEINAKLVTTAYKKLTAETIDGELEAATARESRAKQALDDMTKDLAGYKARYLK